ncbi:MAG TPA: CotH kinase family protein [Vicinamibacterales bacterium]|nr:CotH kinase family protein [Vicinamibacterales bacterium]
MTPRLFVAAAVALLGLLAAPPAHAQSQDEFFDDSTLRDLRLTISQRDWDTLRARADEDTYYTADLRWNGVTVRNIGVRSRGTGTRNGIKPGLRLDVNRYLADQEFLGLKALVLDNGWTDPSTMREVLSMKLFARAGLESPREAHVRLFVNNAYAGLYVAVEPIDRTFITRVFGAAEGHVESGGFLFEYRWLREWHFEDLGDDLAPYAEMFEPKTRETDAASRLYAPLVEIVRLANTLPPERVESELGAKIDLKQFVRYLAIQNVAGEIDGFAGNWGMSNFYLYRFRDGRPAQLIPWDADHAFWDAAMPIDERLGANVLARRALELPSLRQLYLQTIIDTATTLAQAVDGGGAGWLEREASRLEAKIAAATAADPVTPFSFEEFESNAAGLRAFMRGRPPAVACQGRNLLDPDHATSCPGP